MDESIEKWLKSDDGLYEKYYEDYVQAPDKAKWWISKRGTFRDYPGYKQVNQKVSVAPLKDRLVKSLDDEDWAKASKAYKRDVAKEFAHQRRCVVGGYTGGTNPDHYREQHSHTSQFE